MSTDLERIEEDIERLEKAVVHILTVLASAEPVKEAVNFDHEAVPAQYVIEEHEKTECKNLLRGFGVYL